MDISFRSRFRSDSFKQYQLCYLSHSSNDCELCGEEAAAYALHVERTHFTESTPIDEAIVTQEEGLKERQNVYVRGMLSRKGNSYFIRATGSTKLTISSHCITEESVLPV